VENSTVQGKRIVYSRPVEKPKPPNGVQDHESILLNSRSLHWQNHAVAYWQEMERRDVRPRGGSLRPPRSRIIRRFPCLGLGLQAERGIHFLRGESFAADLIPPRPRLTSGGFFAHFSAFFSR
jgi:hypothetical protein